MTYRNIFIFFAISRLTCLERDFKTVINWILSTAIKVSKNKSNTRACLRSWRHFNSRRTLEINDAWLTEQLCTPYRLEKSKCLHAMFICLTTTYYILSSWPLRTPTSDDVIRAVHSCYLRPPPPSANSLLYRFLFCLYQIVEESVVFHNIDNPPPPPSPLPHTHNHQNILLYRIVDMIQLLLHKDRLLLRKGGKKINQFINFKSTLKFIHNEFPIY